MFNHERLKCYCKSLELLKKMPRLTDNWPKGHGYLVDQLKRALSSVTLNIAEGNERNTSKERARFFEIARASASEVAAIMDVADAIRLISRNDCIFIKDELLQIVKMLYKLS